MSLINDALKRASQSDRNRPAQAPLLGRMEPVMARRSSILPWILGVIVVIALAFAGWFFWQWANSAGRVSIEASTLPARIKPVVVARAEPPPAARPGPALAVVPPITPPTAKPAEAPPPVEPKWPVELKLNGIFFNKSNPRALISGETVGPGDEIKGVLIAGIQSDRVILKWNGHTKELVLEGP